MLNFTAVYYINPHPKVECFIIVESVCGTNCTVHYFAYFDFTCFDIVFVVYFFELFGFVFYIESCSKNCTQSYQNVVNCLYTRFWVKKPYLGKKEKMWRENVTLRRLTTFHMSSTFHGLSTVPSWHSTFCALSNFPPHSTFHDLSTLPPHSIFCSLPSMLHLPRFKHLSSTFGVPVTFQNSW